MNLLEHDKAHPRPKGEPKFPYPVMTPSAFTLMLLTLIAAWHECPGPKSNVIDWPGLTGPLMGRETSLRLRPIRVWNSAILTTHGFLGFD